MRYWFGVFFQFFSFALIADTTIQTQIHELDYGSRSEATLVLLTSGDVAKLPQTKTKELSVMLEKARTEKRWLLITINDQRIISAVKKIPAHYLPEEEEEFPLNTSPYVPTVLNTYEEADHIFKLLNPRFKKESQCYNRAHVWSLESFNKASLNSMKVFLFFTRKYIREHDYKWWFHVSPFTYVSENGRPNVKVLDFKYSQGPLDMKPWTDMFMLNHATCPVVKKYSAYAFHQEEADCYLIKASMYYYQPLDLERLENTGHRKYYWMKWETENAYKQGFKWGEG